MWKPIAYGVAVFCGSAMGGALLSLKADALAQPAPLPPAPQHAETTGLDWFPRVIATVSPSVVAVDAVKPPAANTANKGKAQEESGSGVIVRFEGFNGIYAVTNNHVVSGAKASDVTVTLADGRVLRPTRLWADPESDIAVLGLDAPDLAPANLGDSDKAKVGTWVLAFGSPFGLNQTVTHGIISARERGQISLGNTIRIKEFLQTDAAINPGSSGGPLVNSEGLVVGINTAIASNNGNNSGVAFSIPVNLVKRVARELLEKGTVSRGYIGVTLAPTIDPAEALRLGLGRIRGALVEGVQPGSPAEAAGLKRGDVILKLEGVELRDENHLINLISGLPVGQSSELTVWRDRQQKTAKVTVGEYAK